jgi:hypothetical protein
MKAWRTYRRHERLAQGMLRRVQVCDFSATPKTCGKPSIESLRAAAFISRFGFFVTRRGEINHGVDAMTDTDRAITAIVTHNRDGPDQMDLNRLTASLDYLGLLALRRSEPDTVGDSPGR